ncbi:MAG: hypothetical protein ACOCW2_03475 [Chitinivibrionales bacterium]
MSDKQQMHQDDFDSLISDSQDQVKKSHARITLVAIVLIVFGGGVIGVALFTPLLSAEILSGVKFFSIGLSAILMLMGIALFVMKFISEKQQRKQESDAQR